MATAAVTGMGENVPALVYQEWINNERPNAQEVVGTEDMESLV
jgi:hypothetical protein